MNPDRDTSPAGPNPLLASPVALVLLVAGALCGIEWAATLGRWFKTRDAADAGLTWYRYSGLCLGTLLLGGIGCVLTFNFLQAAHRIRYRDTGERQHPDEPWRWHKRWARGRISAGSGRRLAQVCSIALLWNIMAMPLCIVVPLEVIRGGNWAGLLGLCIPGIGCILVFWSLRLGIQWSAFRESVLEMTPVPGIIGGALTGRIHTEIETHPSEGYQVTLRCIKTVREPQRLRPTTACVAWQDTRFVAADPADNAVPVLFAIPFDARPSTGQTSEIQWRLEVRARIFGLDYCARFEVPVFRTAASRPDFRLDESEITPFLRRPDQKARLSLFGIQTHALPEGGRLFFFPMGRYRMTGLLAIFLFHLWLVVSVALCIPSSIPLPVKLSLVLSNLVVLYGTLNLWFHQSRIEVSPGRLFYAAGLVRDRHSQVFSLADIASLTCARSRAPWNRPGHCIRLTTRDGRTTTLARRLPSEAVAEAIRGELSKHLFGLRTHRMCLG